MNNVKRKKTECRQGHLHDSGAEALRCNELHYMLHDGEISDLRMQVKYELLPSFKRRGCMEGERPIYYIADFVYECEGCTVVEDLKSSWTAKDPVYKLKKKMFKCRYCKEGSSIIFREVIRNG